MNWDALAAIGQAFGALAVVASLLYLARQVRHSTLQSHAAAWSRLTSWTPTNGCSSRR